eukprot:TRINITY_DN3387_c0_g1_i1.p1 TRINITY_DN3387_c0_g1~~TRINITY_DN3387_c0_g1_i1.p1  ORF type:complete len:184 (-),score=40.86 TRINITY_DN3387_c0_g1_i1:27-578(-)
MKEAQQQRQLEEEKKNIVSEREVEISRIRKKLLPCLLSIFEIKADGDCMYNAVAHQLSLDPEIQKQKKKEQVSLRKLVSRYMRDHPNEFIPFIDSDTEVTFETFLEYCDQTENTSTWGGQVELKALSCALERCIIVYSADGPEVEMGSEFSDKAPLRLTYHKKYFALGEHYNSTQELEKEDDF